MRSLALPLACVACVQYHAYPGTVSSGRLVLGTPIRDGDEVRLYAATGATTAWLPAREIRIGGGHVCVSIDVDIGQYVKLVRIAGVTDATLPGVAKGLPESVEVRVDPEQRVVFAPGGESLRGWVRDRRREPAEIRYELDLDSGWTPPLTWPQVIAILSDAHPQFGWKLADVDHAELRRVDRAATIATSLLLVPLLVVAVAVPVIREASPPSDRSTPPPTDRDHVKLAPTDPRGGWAPALCDPLARYEPLT